MEKDEIPYLLEQSPEENLIGIRDRIGMAG